MILFVATTWLVISPLLLFLWIPSLRLLSTFTMPFGSYSHGTWGLPWNQVLATYPQAPGPVAPLPKRSLWLERLISASKIPDAPKMYHIKDKVVRRLDPSTSTQWFG